MRLLLGSCLLLALAGCHTPATTAAQQAGERSVKLLVQPVTAGRKLLDDDAVYRLSDIHHVRIDTESLDNSGAATLVGSLSVARTSLRDPVYIQHLRADTRYRFTCVAYKTSLESATTQISTLDDQSRLILEGSEDDTAIDTGTLSVQLADRPRPTITTFASEGAYAMAFDTAGNLYLEPSGADGFKLFKIPAGGTMADAVQLIGNGNIGYVDGTGTSAQIAQLGGIATVSTGPGARLYFSDHYSHGLHMLDLDTLTTTAVGVAPNFPTGGFADGTTTAQVSDPYGLFFDIPGNRVLVADRGNNVVRAIQLGTNDVTTVGGNHTYGNTQDGAPATSAHTHAPACFAKLPSGDVLLGEHGGALRRFGNAAITTVLAHDDNPSDGSSNYASVRGVDAMAVDELGNVFFAENDDGWTASYGRLRRLDVNNDVSTWLPRDGRSGSATYGQNVNLMINCMAMAPDGSLYMSLSSDFADHDEIVVMR